MKSDFKNLNEREKVSLDFLHHFDTIERQNKEHIVQINIDKQSSKQHAELLLQKDLQI